MTNSIIHYTWNVSVAMPKINRYVLKPTFESVLKQGCCFLN